MAALNKVSSKTSLGGAFFRKSILRASVPLYISTLVIGCFSVVKPLQPASKNIAIINKLVFLIMVMVLLFLLQQLSRFLRYHLVLLCILLFLLCLALQQGFLLFCIYIYSLPFHKMHCQHQNN